MKAILLKIDDHKFLLEENAGNDQSMSYILSNKELLRSIIKEGEEVVENLMGYNPKLTLEIKEFKEKTGIIGYPFNMHDVDLYIIDRNIDVVLEVNI